MSSSSSHHYYSSSSSSSRNVPRDDTQLPPLRTVLGDQLALPVYESRYPSAGPTYESHSSRREHGSGSHYTSHPMSSSTAQGYRTSSKGYQHHDVDVTYHAQMNREDVRKYVCTWEGCGKRFERQNALDTHMNIHTDAKPFPCPVCNKFFNVRSNMRRHLLTHGKDYVDPSGESYGDLPHSSSSYYSSR